MLAPVLVLVLVLASVLVSVLVAFMFARSRYSLRLTRLPTLSRWTGLLQDSQDCLKQLSSPREMLAGVAIGVFAWSAEGIALWLILKGIGADIGLFQAIPIYAAATLVGAVTTLPAGLIGTEGSMLVLLQQMDVANAAASAGTVLVRLVTLWFAVGIGLLALVTLRRIYIRKAVVLNEP